MVAGDLLTIFFAQFLNFLFGLAQTLIDQVLASVA